MLKAGAPAGYKPGASDVIVADETHGKESRDAPGFSSFLRITAECRIDFIPVFDKAQILPCLHRGLSFSLSRQAGNPQSVVDAIMTIYLCIRLSYMLQHAVPHHSCPSSK